VCALAGIQLGARSASTRATEEKVAASTAGNKLAKGLAVVILSGLCDPFLNFAFTFGDRVKQEAVAVGARAGAESDAIWALALLGSFVVNTAYCTKLLTVNRTWSHFRESGTNAYWFLAAIMGAIWMSSITLYGRGAALLGPLGGSVGWALFYSAIIIFSTFWGIVAGEWREGGGRPLRTLFFGLAVLIAAIVVLAYGNTLPIAPGA
jgi:L-rhamnose-H+ transport protein